MVFYGFALKKGWKNIIWNTKYIFLKISHNSYSEAIFDESA